MPPQDEIVYLRHIRDCCERVIHCAALRLAAPAPERILPDAVCRNLEIMGEASRKIGPEFRTNHPEVPWRKMDDLRNVPIHNDDNTDADLMWGLAAFEIPKLLPQIPAVPVERTA